MKNEILFSITQKAKNKINTIENGCFSYEDFKFINGAIQSRKQFNGKQINLLFVGQPTKKKNFILFENLVSLLEEKAFKINARVLGKISDTRIVNQKSKKTKSIEYVGQKNDRREVIDQYFWADFLIFPSFFESSGLPLTEAMACGCVVLGV